MADRGHRNAAPKIEEELSEVTGDQGVPRKAGGRVEDPEESEDPDEGSEGWEVPGSPRNVPSGSNGCEDEVCAVGGLGGAVCTPDRFALKRSCRSWDMGLAGDADGGPGQELQLTGTSESPRRLRAALPRSP